MERDACACDGRPRVIFEAGRYLENDAARRARRWAVSKESPNSREDPDSPTGQTMSAKSWALYAKEKADESEAAAASVVPATEEEILDTLND